MNDKDKLLEIINKNQDYGATYAKSQMDERKTYIYETPNSVLADSILADGWIKPPCKVGDKVYLPCLNDWGDIENYTITEFVLDNDGLLFVVDDEDRETHPIEEIGTDVFLTKEEAEKALKHFE